MERSRRGPLTLLANALGQVAVAVYIIVDSIIGPLFRPLMRWLSSLHIVKRIEAGIAALPAYVILVCLVLPFVAEELVKVYAVVMMGGGHFKIGFSIYVSCHVFSILICERIYRAGREKLMTIPWFARMMTWLIAHKDRMVAWFKATALYRQAAAAKARLRLRARGLLGRTKAAFGR